MGGSKTVYFKEYPRRDHTEETLRIARERADELGIDTILVSTRVGDSAVRATEVFRGKRVIAVTHVTGFHVPKSEELSDRNRKTIEANGGVVLSGAHALFGDNAALRKKFRLFLLGDVIVVTAANHRCFPYLISWGTRAGLGPAEADVISIASDPYGGVDSFDMAVVFGDEEVDSGGFCIKRIKEVLCELE